MQPLTRKCPQSFPAPDAQGNCPHEKPYKRIKTYANGEKSECCYAKPEKPNTKPKKTQSNVKKTNSNSSSEKKTKKSNGSSEKKTKKSNGSSEKKTKRKCENDFNLLGDDVQEIDQKTFYKSWDGYCYDINELANMIISSNGKNQCPYVQHESREIWRDETELKNLFRHPGLEKDLKKKNLKAYLKATRL